MKMVHTKTIYTCNRFFFFFLFKVLDIGVIFVWMTNKEILPCVCD